MAVAQYLRPHWNGRIDELRGQQEKLRQTVCRTMTRRERITSEERATFEDLWHELLGMI